MGRWRAAQIPEPPVAVYPAVAATLLPIQIWTTSGISPFDAIRAMVLVAIAAMLVVVATRIVTGEKHLAGIVAIIVALGLLIGGRQPLAAFALVTVALIVLRLAARRGSVDWAWMGRQIRRAVSVVS